MCDTVFAFTEDGGYHFECPSMWYHAKLPSRVATRFDEDRVSCVYTLAFGPSNAFAMCYQSRDDGRAYVEIQNLHRDLSDFIFPKYSYGRQRKYENLRISLGPSPGSFWATDGIESRWNNIPAQLEDALRRHKPRVVTLGVGDNFILLAQDGDWAYHLPNYRALDELLGNYILAKGGLDWISNIVLNPHRPGSFVVQSKKGKLIAERFPLGSERDMASIKQHIETDTRKQNLVPVPPPIPRKPLPSIPQNVQQLKTAEVHKRQSALIIFSRPLNRSRFRASFVK